MPICTLLSPEEPYSKIRRRELQCYLLLVKPVLSHHKHEYVTKEVELDVKMISHEVQFCLCLILAYSEASRYQFLVHRLPTYTSTISYHYGMTSRTLHKAACHPHKRENLVHAHWRYHLAERCTMSIKEGQEPTLGVHQTAKHDARR